MAFLRSRCNEQIAIFLQICKEINFPISMEKTIWATNILVFLGFLINTITQSISVPTEKIDRALSLIQSILKNKKTTVNVLQKLCGFLNFLCRCFVPGRAFTRRIYAYFASNMKPYHHIRVNQEIRSDLTMWLEFLTNPVVYCRPFIDYTATLKATDLKRTTDALGKIGVGGVCNSHWFQAKWTK